MASGVMSSSVLKFNSEIKETLDVVVLEDNTTIEVYCRNNMVYADFEGEERKVVTEMNSDSVGTIQLTCDNYNEWLELNNKNDREILGDKLNGK